MTCIGSKISLSIFVHLKNFFFPFRFGGRQIHASEDDGVVNHAMIRDWDEDAARLEQFGAELEAD